MCCTLHCTFTVYFLSHTYESKGFWHFSLILETIQQWKSTVPVLYNIKYSFKGWQNNKNHAFPSKHCISNEKMCYCYTFYNENLTTYLYINFNKEVLLKNILAYCGYSPTSFFLLLSEHKHCNNAATNLNSKNAWSRMLASLWGSVGMETKEDEWSTGCIWAAGFHHVMALSLLARIFKLMNSLFL